MGVTRTASFSPVRYREQIVYVIAKAVDIRAARDHSRVGVS